MKRTVIKIDENLCNGCGNCVVGCHEGALQLIDGKAVMISDLYCDGLGACIGECPVGAISFEEREAEPYDEAAVMERLVPKGEATVLAHLRHLKYHGETEWLKQGAAYLREHGIKDIGLSKIGLDTEGNPIEAEAPLVSAAPVPGTPAAEEISKTPAAHAAPAAFTAPAATAPHAHEAKPSACGCPGSMPREIRNPRVGAFAAGPVNTPQPHSVQQSELRHFPVQLHLVNPQAGFFRGADLLLAADCTAFASGDFHDRFLKGKVLAIACPKLDGNMEPYIDKLVEMMDSAGINTLTVLVMEVPCCRGLVRAAQIAREQARRNVPLKVAVLSVGGEVMKEEWI